MWLVPTCDCLEVGQSELYDLPSREVDGTANNVNQGRRTRVGRVGHGPPNNLSLDILTYRELIAWKQRTECANRLFTSRFTPSHASMDRKSARQLRHCLRASDSLARPRLFAGGGVARVQYMQGFKVQSLYWPTQHPGE